MSDLDRLASHFRTLIADHQRDEARYTGESAAYSHIAAAAFQEALQCVENVAAGKPLSSEPQTLSEPHSDLSDDPEATEHQPREHPVACQDCRRETWNIDALCDECERRAECRHEHLDYEPMDREVGYLTETWTCEDCEQDVTELMVSRRDEARIDAMLYKAGL